MVFTVRAFYLVLKTTAYHVQGIIPQSNDSFVQPERNRVSSGDHGFVIATLIQMVW